MIWDRYLPDSTKSSTREKRGRGIRIQVLPPTLMPSNFKKFLLVADKVRLFAFLAGQLAQLHVEGKLIITTIDNTAHTSLQIPYPADMITPCNHEEANSCLLLHAAHCLATGHERIIVTTVDSDVVVLAIFAAAALNPLYKLEKLWVEFMVGRKDVISLHMNWQARWDLTKHEPCLFFMQSLAVIQLVNSKAKRKRLHGKLGMHFLRLHRHSYP